MPESAPLLRVNDALGRSRAELYEGEVLAGKYKVTRVIGEGGMGVVLEARHISLDQMVAIKVLRPAMLEIPGMVGRFSREARAASKITSEHVARVTDVGELPSGVPFMVMEHLAGEDLLAILKARGTIDVADAARWIADACDAIGEAHGLGIVHRDLKPGNLFLAKKRNGRVSIKVLDFGISKIEAGADEATRTGQLLGSPKYMAPEQMSSSKDVDGRADIWGLGAVLFTLLTGRPPFLADTAALICSKVLNEDPPPPRSLRPDLPEAIEAVILRCLQRNPAKRFATAAELAEALAPFYSAGARATDPTPTPAPRPPTIATLIEQPAPLEEPRPLPVAPPPSPSVTPMPPSAARSATISTWDAGEAPRSRKRTWIVAALIACALAAGLIALVTRRGDSDVHAAAGQVSATPVVSSVPEAPTAVEGAAPPASVTAGSAPSADATALPPSKRPWPKKAGSAAPGDAPAPKKPPPKDLFDSRNPFEPKRAP